MLWEKYSFTSAAILFCSVLSIVISSRIGSCEKLPVVSDKSIITFSLKDYNVSNPNGESFETMYLLKSNSSTQIDVTSIPKDAYFVLLQVHSYFKNVTLSYYPKETLDTSVTGMNIGLIKINRMSVLTYHLSYNSSPDNATILIAVQAYGINAPIPGGCNMEFNVETSPFLKTSFNDAVIVTDFAPAAPPTTFLPGLSLTSDSVCNIKPNPLTYKMYRMYLPERSFSKDLYFSSLKLMMTKSGIIENGRLFPDKYVSSPMRHIYASYPGIGSVFVVVAETNNGSSVYVPSFTYSCHHDKEIGDCRVLTTTFSKLLCAAIFFLGLFACFAAHRFHNAELFLTGFISGTIVSYIAALRFHTPVALTVSVGIGCFCGVVFILIWCCIGRPLFSLFSSTSVLGYLAASAVFYGLVDVFDALENDFNYWTLFCSVLLLCPTLMVSLSEKANVIACSVVGSYASILALDYYVGSNLRYIVINTIRRATVERFRHAAIDPPFQTKDIVLTVLWLTLAVAGITVHLLLLHGRPPYPVPHNPFRTTFRLLLNTVSSPRQRSTERTPLLRPYS